MADFKQCCTCHEVLPVSEFNKRRKAKDGLQSRCRACSREWYLENRVEHGRTTRIRSKRIRDVLADRLIDYLLCHPCVDCGERDIRCLEFDHRDRSSKVSEVTAMIANQKSWDLIEAEIKKCDVRCANCHRRRTAAQFNTRRHRIVMLLAQQRDRESGNQQSGGPTEDESEGPTSEEVA